MSEKKSESIELEVCSVMSKEAKEALKPNPAAVLAGTVKNMRAGMTHTEAETKAKKDALEAGKFAGMSRLKWERDCLIRSEIERELAAEKTEKEAEEEIVPISEPAIAETEHEEESGDVIEIPVATVYETESKVKEK